MTLTYGYSVTAEFCGFPEPRAVVRQYGKWISQHATRDEAFAAITERDGARPWLYRGDHKLPHQSQQVGRDLTAERIVRHNAWGLPALAHRQTPEQMAETDSVYEYLLYTPESGATNWTAFRTREEFETWMAAYDVTLDTDFEAIPDDFDVKVLDNPADGIDPALCGSCGRWWDDGVTTSRTPVPAGRCPFEYFHDHIWPEPGESFKVRLPTHDSRWLPLEQRADDED
jgi:hypothetical protein